MPRPATPAPSYIGITSSRIPTAAEVPPSALCVERPLQYLGPSPVTTAPVPAALPDSAAVAFYPLIILASEAAAVPCPASPHAEIISASLGPASAPNTPALASDHLDSDALLSVTMATASTIQHTPCLNSFLAGKQRPTLSPPPVTSNHPFSLLLKTYVDLGCPASVGPAWPLYTIKAAIFTVPHTSTLTPQSTTFFRQ